MVLSLSLSPIPASPMAAFFGSYGMVRFGLDDKKAKIVPKLRKNLGKC